MLASINRVGFAAPSDGIGFHRKVAILELDSKSDTLEEQIQYLEDIQTLVLVHADLIRYRSTPTKYLASMSGIFKVFITDAEIAMMFRLQYVVKMVVFADMWFKPLDKEMEKILLN
ncbi:hypothetical protein D3C87_587790 [compost metagenome]